MRRTIAILPVIHALVGAGCGVCLAMVFWQEPSERAHVYLDDSMPLALAGLVAGALMGGIVSAACSRWPGVASAVIIVSSALLGAALAAPVGWIVGDLRDGRCAREGMTVGMLVGVCVGLVIGAAQVCSNRRTRAADAGSTI